MARARPAVLSVFDVEPRFIGGTETYARELSSQLGLHGWRSLLCFSTTPPAPVRRFLEAENVSLARVDYVNGGSFAVLGQLTRVLGRHRPRIVHFHYTDLLSPGPWLARLLSADRVFFTDHSSRPAHYSVGRASLPKRLLARAITWPLSGVISVSGYGHRCFTTRGLFPSARTRMIYNGVDLTRVAESRERAAAFRQRFSIPGDRTIVLQVSWIIPEKGIPDLLAAARVVLSRRTDVHFVIVGDGAFREEYTRQARELGLTDHLTWTGLVEDPFTAGVYDAADVVCQVSRWEEVFGWVIAEAMAYRKPVVATRVGGIPELVTDGETGFLVERGGVQGLADRIVALCDDPARRRAMGLAARRKVDASFDLRKNVSRLLEAYGIPETARAEASAA
jgi:glycosyltransferase involved in cell wall biosynthesis